jgi:hypothetical protein
MKVIHEGTIGSYSFQMIDENTIEVWGFDNERPESFIFVKDGCIKSKKDFDMEISYWYMENVG